MEQETKIEELKESRASLNYERIEAILNLYPSAVFKFMPTSDKYGQNPLTAFVEKNIRGNGTRKDKVVLRRVRISKFNGEVKTADTVEEIKSVQVSFYANDLDEAKQLRVGGR